MLRAVRGSAACAVRLNLPAEAFELLERFVRESAGSLNEAEAHRQLAELLAGEVGGRRGSDGKIRLGSRGPGESLDLRAAHHAAAVRHLEAARTLLTGLESAAEPAAAKELRALRVSVNNDLANLLVREDMSWLEPDRTDEEAAREVPPGTNSFDYWERISRPKPGLRADAEGQPIFPVRPGAYRPGLGAGRKFLFLMQENRELDDTRQRSLTASADEWEAKERTRFLESLEFAAAEAHRLSQPGWELADDDWQLLVDSRPRRITLPATESPMAHWREISRRYPNTPTDASARLAAADFYSRRGRYAEALRELASLPPATPAALRKAAAKDKASILELWILLPQDEEARIPSPDGTNATPIALPDAPVRLAFRARNVREVEFTAQRLDVAQVNLENFRTLVHSPAKPIGKSIRWREQVRQDDTRRAVDSHTTAPLREPGWYLVRAQAAGARPVQIQIYLTEAVVLLKNMPDQTLACALDSRTGAPLAGRTLRGFTRRPEQKPPGLREHPRQTDAQGTATWSKAGRPSHLAVLLTEAKGGGHAFAMTDPGPPRSEIRKVSHVYCDRPVYRPGSKVQFRAWVRSWDGARYLPPQAGQPIQFRFHSSSYGKRMERTIPTDEFGGVSGEIELPDDAELGEWWCSIREANAKHAIRGTILFRVEEYRKPEFEVTIEPAAKIARLGEPVRSTISARYLFGAPVQGSVRYRVVRAEYPVELPPPQNWPFYAAIPESPYRYPWIAWHTQSEQPREVGARAHRRDVVLRGEQELRPDGTLELSFETAGDERDWPGCDHHYSIHAEVIDAGRRTISADSVVVASRTDFQAEVSSAEAWLDGPGELKVDVRTCRLDGTAVEAEGELTASRLSFHGETGQDVREESLGRWPVRTDGTSGTASVPARLEKSGQYRLRFVSRDARGRTVDSSAMAWVLGPELAGERLRTHPLELIPQRQIHRPGETARVLIVSAQPGAHVLFGANESNGVLRSWKLLHLAERLQVVEVPLPGPVAPSQGMSACTVRDGRIERALAKILVPPVAGHLQVQVESDKPVYNPGETARVRAAVRDSTGGPAQGEILLKAYDDALQAFAPAQTPLLYTFQADPVGVFDALDSSLRALESGHRRDRSRELRHFPATADFGSFGDAPDDAEPARVIVTGSYVPTPAPIASIAQTAGVNGAKPPQVRSNFADTALWLPRLVLAADGTAQAEFRLPDSVTRWRIQGAAITPATAVGEGETTAQAAKKVVVRLQAPRFFIENDELVVSAVHSEEEAAQQVHGELLVPAALLAPVLEGAAASDGEGRLTLRAQAELAPRGQHRFDWRLRARRPGLAKLTVQALAGVESDAMELEVPVLVHGTEKQLAQAGAFAARQEGTRELHFEIPREIDPTQSRLEVTVTPSLASVLVGALPHLVDYPYGCVEQTVSRFFPALLVQGLLKELGTTLEAVAQAQSGPPLPERRAALTDRELGTILRVGTERLVKLQRRDGGWGWWSDDTVSLFQTAYVLLGLHEAKAEQADLLRTAKRGREFLREVVKEELAKPARKRELGAPNEQAFVAYVLGLTDAPDFLPGWLRELHAERAKLDHQGRALLTLALHRAGLRAEAALTLRNLLQFLERDAENQTAWIRPPTSGWWHWYHNDVETNAWTLRAVLALEPRSERAPELAKWLMQSRRGGGYWRSTRDTALAICAVADYLRVSGEGKGECSVRLSLDGGPAEEIHFTRSGFAAQAKRIELRGPQLAPGAHTIALTKAGNAPLHYSASLNFFTQEPDIQSAGGDLRVERAYYALGDTPGPDGRVPRTLLAQGDPVRSGQEIEVVLTVEAKNTYDYLAFEDRKPAGCEPVRLLSGGTHADGFCANVELRETKVVFFVGELPQGAHELRYRLRAEAPGHFRAPPATAFAMYAPELRANSRTQRMQVRD